MTLRATLRCCTLRYPLSPLHGQKQMIKNKRWMLSTREWLTFLPTNTTSRKWLVTPLRHDVTLTKSRSDVSRPTAAFRSFVDAKLLNRFRFTMHTWRVLAAVFALIRLEGFVSPYNHFKDAFIGAELATMTSYTSEQNLPR